MAEDRIGKIAEDVAYIRAQVDALLIEAGDHETRIRGLEKIRNYAGGIGLVAALLFGVQ